MKPKFFFLLIFSVFFFGLFVLYHSPSQQFNNDNNSSIKTPFRSLFQTILPKKTEPITIIAVGDIMLGRAVNARMR